MKAKDTVMSREQLDIFWLNPEECDDESVAEAQAEITWDIASTYGFEIGIEQGKAEGRREVVEWINNNIAFANIGLSYKEWQAFKKEKGIK